MKFQRHAPRTFTRRVESLLASAREENHLIEALARRLEDGTMTLAGTPVLATVDEGDTAVLAALRTPPGNIILSTGPIDAAKLLALELARAEVALPGVTGPREPADAFSAAWPASRELVHLARVRVCSGVPAVTPASGRLRQATEDDTERLVAWVDEFGPGVFAAPGDRRRFVTRRVMERAFFVWEVDKEPVCMACIDSETTRGVRIDWIYAPPAHRGRGYAKSCVAMLSQRLLDGGRDFCLAYAITADARANAFLERVGFRARGVQATWRFLPRAE